MKRDPLAIVLSMLFNVNLLEPGKEYTINEVASRNGMKNHWVTVKKYLRMFSLIKKYSPEVRIDEGNVIIEGSGIYDKLEEIEKFIIYLASEGATDEFNPVEIPERFDTEEIRDSAGHLWDLVDGKAYVNECGLEIYRSIKHDLSDLIWNEKEISEVFQ